MVPAIESTPVFPVSEPKIRAEIDDGQIGRKLSGQGSGLPVWQREENNVAVR
jgi:hypothetical protein